MLSASLRLEAYKSEGFWYLASNNLLIGNHLADALEANCADCDDVAVVVSCDGKTRRDCAGDSDGGRYRLQVWDSVTVIVRQVQLNVERDGKSHVYLLQSPALLRECEAAFESALESELCDQFAA